MRIEVFLSLLFDEWAARVARGERPDPREYLARARTFGGELARVMDAFLVAAPRPVPDEETGELARAWLDGRSPLAELRARRGLERDAVVDTIVSEFALERRAVVEAYYERLESGHLAVGGVSPPLRDLFTRVLGPRADTARVWRLRRAARAAPALREDDEHVRSLFAPGP